MRVKQLLELTEGHTPYDILDINTGEVFYSSELDHYLHDYLRNKKIEQLDTSANQRLEIYIKERKTK